MSSKVIALVENLKLIVPASRLPGRDTSESLQSRSTSVTRRPQIIEDKEQPTDKHSRELHAVADDPSWKPTAADEDDDDEDGHVEQETTRKLCSRRTRKRNSGGNRTREVEVRRNPIRSAAAAAAAASLLARKESGGKRRKQHHQQQQQRLHYMNTRSLGRRSAAGNNNGSRNAREEAPNNRPRDDDEVQWRQWPVHGMHERPVYHPQFGLAAEYNGRLFASFDGQGYREVIDLEVVRVDPRLQSADEVTAPPSTPRPRLSSLWCGLVERQQQQLRALEQLRSLERLRRLRMQLQSQPRGQQQTPTKVEPPQQKATVGASSLALPLCDVQAFKSNANGKMFFVKAPERSTRSFPQASGSSSVASTTTVSYPVQQTRRIQPPTVTVAEPTTMTRNNAAVVDPSLRYSALDFTSSSTPHLGQALDLSTKQTTGQRLYKIDIDRATAAASAKATSAINLVRYFQNFGADDSIDLLEEPKSLT